VKAKFVLIAVLCGAGLLGCRRDSPARKIIDGAPIGSTITVLPVNAVQGFHMLERNMLNILVAVTKRTGTISPTYPDVTGGPGTYQFTTIDSHYGQATISFQYFDGPNGAGTPLDPIAGQASTATVKSVNISVTSTGSPFNGTGNFVLTLETQGNVNSNLFLTGTFTMTSTTYTVICTLPSPGGLATFTGLAAGTVQFSGSGPGGSIGGTTIINTSHEFNGNLLWDGNTGQIHLKENADALLILNNQRYFFD
jgi:hypothetical protein